MLCKESFHSCEGNSLGVEEVNLRIEYGTNKALQEAYGPLVILGIDPGTATAGFGVVGFSAGKLAPIGYGTIRTSSRKTLPQRLLQIYGETKELLATYAPDVVAVEQLFFSRNVTTAFAVGQARGVFLLAAAEGGLQVAEYTPHQVKQAVTGEGAAKKRQVAFMVRVLLGLKKTPSPDDAADALAIAICHAHLHSTATRLEQAYENAEKAGGTWS